MAGPDLPPYAYPDDVSQIEDQIRLDMLEIIHDEQRRVGFRPRALLIMGNPDQSSAKAALRAELVFDAIKANGPIKVKELSVVMDITVHRAREVINPQILAGPLVYIGHNPPAYDLLITGKV